MKIRHAFVALGALCIGGQAMAQAVVNRMVCHQIAPIVGGIATATGQLANGIGPVKQLSILSDAFPEGTKEHEAMVRFQAELTKALAAIEELRKASRDAAYTMDVCDRG